MHGYHTEIPWPLTVIIWLVGLACFGISAFSQNHGKKEGPAFVIAVVIGIILLVLLPMSVVSHTDTWPMLSKKWPNLFRCIAWYFLAAVMSVIVGIVMTKLANAHHQKQAKKAGHH